MTELCPVCGNELEQGDCGNLAVYCNYCNYGEGIGINHKEEQERLLKNGKEILLDYLKFISGENNLPITDQKAILKRMYRHYQKMVFDAKCVPWTFEEELKRDDL